MVDLLSVFYGAVVCREVILMRLAETLACLKWAGLA